ncbi:Rieske 2Fe-2S domain-containing protein [Actinomadura rugatobispora]|uniref:Rieske 2Fe-2S domain-containing protein n=1 Tax=Actinomadura rugatobispora TaxID=1994 RepID=A0ABW1A418_9ACTN|nr:aromatic ring-hydroxylating dioxygenase subunit alpha [Actinomadura rugatobispora]
MTERSIVDTGTGYGRKTPSYDARLTEAGPGTPMGEALRRYWQPIATSAALTPDVPHRTRVLGEDLVVFRDGRGRPGVVFERCAHRGASLYFGRVEEDGIRCCYHGWKFDVQGHCLAQAGEPDRGRRRDAVRQPWYPVEERYGLVFVYMGPPDRKPVLPRYDCLEPQEEGEKYYAEWPVPGMNVTGLVQDFNWLQIYENAIDPVHINWLHSQHSGYQFLGTGTTGFPEDFYDPDTVADRVGYDRTEFGAKYGIRFLDKAENGVRTERVWGAELHLPNVLVLPDFVKLAPDAKADMLLWVIPSDDTSHRSFFSIRSSDPERLDRFFYGVKQNGKDPWELTEEEQQRFPGDGEAQRSQGAITLHSEETLATSDRGVVMLRRLLKAMVADVEAGRDPQGVSLVDVPPRHTEAGLFSTSAAAVPAAGR